MIIVSFNIRGGGNALKRRRISSILKKGDADIVLIQETKLTNMEDFVAKSMWSNTDVGFSFTNTVGMSGGILTLWRTERVEVIHSFKGEGYIGIKVFWKGNIYYVVSVYSSCLLFKKKELWENLVHVKSSFTDGNWIIGGDFKAIKNSSKRKGRMGREVDNGADHFWKFIDDMDLVDVPCKGKRFSWYSGNGMAMSRIDRFLVLDVIVNRWGWWVN
ncbi:uncharacterized protein LOC131641186 [Vicia villosa]|uniref:uncharacterized protein LOC131641186 n=1 Tax=Vicia villosa TaxID=3911 RepID=UPI00273BACDA|nr:uncharacterized protein LOC131641186 [Vicia villosa]